MAQEYLSIRQAAELLGYSWKSVRRRIAHRELPAQRLGGVYRVRRQDVLALLQHVGKQSVPLTPAEQATLRRHGLL